MTMGTVMPAPTELTNVTTVCPQRDGERFEVKREWTNAWRVEKDPQNESDFIDLMCRLPELQKCFEPVLGLPVVQLSVEIESINEMDLEGESVRVQYALMLDWFDVMTTDEYNLSKGSADFYSK